MSDHASASRRLLDSCFGKRRFPTWPDANRTAARGRRKHDGNANAYHCQHCNGYHVGERQAQRINLRHNAKLSEQNDA